MLTQLVERTCADIEALDMAEAVPLLWQQLKPNSSGLLAQLMRGSAKPGKTPSEESASAVTASAALLLIKSLPGLARRMLAAVTEEQVPIAQRCAVASALAYFVQPRDLIPDSAPGGYGYLDDAVLLNAGVIACLDTFPDAAATLVPETNAEGAKQVLGFLVGLLPPAAREPLQSIVVAMKAAIRGLTALDPAILESLLAQVVADPLGATTTAVPKDFVPGSTTSSTDGRLFGGMYIEGDNLFTPGGAALVGGQLILPTLPRG